MDNAKSGKLIMEARKEKGMTQKALAEKLGISDRTVSKWERGAGFPDVSILPDLAEALGLSINELIGGERREPQTEQTELVRSVVVIQKRQLGKKIFRTRLTAAVLALLLLAMTVFVIVRWPEPQKDRIYIEDYYLTPEEQTMALPMTEEGFCALFCLWLDTLEYEIEPLHFEYADGGEHIAMLELMPNGMDEPYGYIKFWRNAAGEDMLSYNIIDKGAMINFVAVSPGDREDYRPTPERLTSYRCIDMAAMLSDGSAVEYARFHDWAAAMFKYIFGIDRSVAPKWRPFG